MSNITIENIDNNVNLNKYLTNIDKDTNYFVYIKDEVVKSIVSIKYLDWDSKIFNKKIGLLNVNYGVLNNKILNKIDEFCLEENYNCLFTKATTKEYEKMHVLEDGGFNLMDSIVTLKKELKENTQIVENEEFNYKILQESDLQNITSIIDNLCSFGRFFVDNELDNEEVKEEYIEEIINEKLPELYPIGLALGTYIVCENEKGIYLIDQHASEERVNYERNSYLLSHPSNNVISPLVPIVITIPNNEYIKIKEKPQA